MPTLAVTGNMLGGNSKDPTVIIKKRRMKIVSINGVMLISLAIFLYYQSHYRTLDGLFLSFQLLELILGLVNLTLIGMNVRSGMILSRRIIGSRP